MTVGGGCVCDANAQAGHSVAPVDCDEERVSRSRLKWTTVDHLEDLVKRLLVAMLLFLMVGGVSAADSFPKQLDPRLDKAVTIEVEHAKLDDVAKRLSGMSGIDIKAGSGERDWRVRERRVTLCVKDTALKSVLRQISELLNYRISQDGKPGEWKYLIWQDVKSRELEEEMLLVDLQAAEARLADSRKSVVDLANKALSMSPEELQKLESKDPYLAYFGATQAGRGRARLLVGLGSHFPTWDDIGRYGTSAMVTSASDLSPDLLQAASDALSGKRRQPGGKAALKPTMVEMIPQKPGDSDSGLGGNLFITGAWPDGQTDTITVPLAPPGSGQANEFAAVQLASEEDGDPLATAKSRGKADAESGDLASSLGRRSPTEENPPTDPELTREVDLGDLPKLRIQHREYKLRSGDTVKTMAAISKATGYTVYLESFDGMTPPGLVMKSGKQPLYHILIALEKAGCIWQKDGEILRIRPDNWATLRSYAVPESVLGHWKSTLAKQGEFTLNDLAGMVTSLTPSQIGKGLYRNPDLTFALDYGLWGNGFLRFYGSLSAPQKASLGKRSGLGFSSLDARQWDLLGAALPDSLRSAYIQGGGIRLLPEERKQALTDGAFHETANDVRFGVTLQVDGEDAPRETTLAVNLVKREAIAEGMKRRQQDLAQEVAETTQKPETAGK